MNFNPGKLHTIFQIGPRSVRDVNRIATKMKMFCGAYTIQSTRSSCNQSTVNLTCQLCNVAEETLEHFILHCAALGFVRTPIKADINTVLSKTHNVKFHELSEYNQIQIILDCTTLLKNHKNRKCSTERLSHLEFYNRRLVHSLLGFRYRLLKAIPKRQG